MNARFSVSFLLIFLGIISGFIACSSDDSPSHSTGDMDLDLGEIEEEEVIVFYPEAAAKAFQLYYKERVERSVTAYQRYGIFGDTGFGVTIGKAGVARENDDLEIVPGPNDNNMIGLSVWTAWNAYKIFRSRKLALGMVRMFDGLAFMESVSGHPGLTARNAYPGWTLTIDGVAGTASRSRDGQTVVSPTPIGSELESEIIHAFFDGLQVTYRENPAEFMFDYMPATEVGPYCVTYGFSMLPDYIRVSDCCTSLMQTPEGYDWSGAFWSNHNSRDNFPDLGLGYLAALEASQMDELDEDVKAAALRAWESGNRVGDSIQTHEGKLMTVDEHHGYDTLTVAGKLRPDGETEIEDLGSLSSCPMAFLGRAISSEGLSLPSPALPLPGSIEFIMEGLFDECKASDSVRLCQQIDEAYCGANWENLDQLHFFGSPWLEMAQQIENDSPGSAETLIGSFQDDYYEMTLGMMALTYYARIRKDAELLKETQMSVSHLTDLMRTFADIIYKQTKPDRWKRRRYEAALFDAWAERDPIPEDLYDFDRAESAAAYLDTLLDFQEASPAELLTDEEIAEKVEDRLSARSDTVKARYEETYGSTVPPFRVTEDGYEARIHSPEGTSDWQTVERPRHKVIGGFKLLEALPLCVTNPEILHCAWAQLGCERPDLDASGSVDQTDLDRFTSLETTYAATTCKDENDWCEGADLDRSGNLDSDDRTFMEAAQGCWYEVK